MQGGTIISRVIDPGSPYSDYGAVQKESVMPAYAIAHLRHVNVGPAIVEYLQRIDATLDPYGGRFLIHGGPVEALEGSFRDDLIVIEFPNRENAHAWYAGPEYQEILHLRTDNAEGETFIIDGVPDGYRGADALAKLVPPSINGPRLDLR